METEARKRARELREMLSTPGWRQIEALIDRRRNQIVSQLQSETFRDLLAAGRLQGELEGYDVIRKHIRTVIAQAERVQPKKEG